MVDVFHHIPDVERFLSEAAFCVKTGGAIIMVEPWVTHWSRLVYKYLHHEPIDTGASEWKMPDGNPLSSANSALPWIVFERDRDRFQRTFSQWKVKSINLHTPFAYLFSGGVSMRASMPGYFFNISRKLEQLFSQDIWSMFATIVLERK